MLDFDSFFSFHRNLKLYDLAINNKILPTTSKEPENMTNTI